MRVLCSHCQRQVETGDVPAGAMMSCSCGAALMVPRGPQQAGKMSCPGCGAPVDPAMRVCSYCDTRLATAVCPNCFATTFEGSKHCSACGQALGGRVVVMGEETEHACPRCKVHVLRIEVVDRRAVERCVSCDGLWIDRDTVERLR